jgi:hypothetical protein
MAKYVLFQQLSINYTKVHSPNDTVAETMDYIVGWI